MALNRQPAICFKPSNQCKSLNCSAKQLMCSPHDDTALRLVTSAFMFQDASGQSVPQPNSAKYAPFRISGFARPTCLLSLSCFQVNPFGLAAERLPSLLYLLNHSELLYLQSDCGAYPANLPQMHSFAACSFKQLPAPLLLGSPPSPSSQSQGIILQRLTMLCRV